MAVFTVTEVSDLESKDMNLFFPVGLPKGHDKVRAGINLEPKLVKITPNVGSVGGTWITATVPGVGTKTKDLDLVNSKDNKSICRRGSLKVSKYGVVQCWTERINFGETALTIKLK